MSRPALWLALALLSTCWSACWTGGSPAPAPSGAPAAGCPARLTGILRNADDDAPLHGATVVVETPAGSVATELTDERGRFETAAVRPPARLVIYYDMQTTTHALVACQPPLRLGIHLER